MSRRSVSGTIKEEINNARANLDSLLQRIGNCKNSSGLVQTDEEDDAATLTDRSPGREGGAREGSPKRKGAAGQSGKKRKKQASENIHAIAPNTYIVKLFERSVDLAPYGETTPLYPVCRSWMRNSASEQYVEQSTAPDLQGGGEAQFPDPYMTSEDEDLYKLRIPEPLKTDDKPLDIYAEPEDAANLLINHISHWKKVRESWRTAGKAYDARFATSHALIKQMYESASK